MGGEEHKENSGNLFALCYVMTGLVPVIHDLL